MPTGHEWSRLQIVWVAAITATISIVCWLRPPTEIPPREWTADSRPPGTWPLYDDTLEANAATAEDLALLDSVGPSIARRLVASRAARGGWCSLSEVEADAHLGVRWSNAARELRVQPASRCVSPSARDLREKSRSSSS